MYQRLQVMGGSYEDGLEEGYEGGSEGVDGQCGLLH